MRAHLAERDDDVARLQGAGGRAGQQRRVEHEVDVVDEDQLRRLLREDPLELAGCVRPREAPSGDDDVVSHGVTVTACNLTLQSRQASSAQQAASSARGRTLQASGEAASGLLAARCLTAPAWRGSAA